MKRGERGQIGVLLQLYYQWPLKEKVLWALAWHGMTNLHGLYFDVVNINTIVIP